MAQGNFWLIRVNLRIIKFLLSQAYLDINYDTTTIYFIDNLKTGNLFKIVLKAITIFQL